MTIDNKYDLGQEVYLKTDPEQHVRIVTKILVLGGGGLVYEVSFIGQNTDHYECELSTEKDVVKSLT